MTHSLRLQFETDQDGHGELFAAVEVGNFKGVGSAWFSATEILELARSLKSSYPLTKELPVQLKGGTWHPGGAHLESIQVGLSFYAIDGRGGVACRVQLATSLSTEDRSESQSMLAVELLTSYEQLLGFAHALEALVAGVLDEATLQ